MEGSNTARRVSDETREADLEVLRATYETEFPLEVLSETQYKLISSPLIFTRTDSLGGRTTSIANISEEGPVLSIVDLFIEKDYVAELAEAENRKRISLYNRLLGSNPSTLVSSPYEFSYDLGDEGVVMASIIVASPRDVADVLIARNNGFN